ncbi:putative inactive 1-aminocyclopropane-1-carboxylate synthase-like protein 2 [Caerostris extrusa]|uniref:Inactive 1-aminocyclopropane-1-carboxylate synthase-like protein 2 n=1 Tax=Caerostris extrusa TaxID=172846 RepID=A0AAV4XY33_CAEEX|nr:putative inactive 1-aminocyclopropane-1-carboxylate synthase-like protein 2 [Caerostris extrusa]
MSFTENGDISNRAEILRNWEDFLLKYMNICNEDEYDEISNPNYREGYGTLRLRKALAAVMTEFLNTHQPVDPENLICVAGVTACIDVLAHCLADPGEVILTQHRYMGELYRLYAEI